MKLSDDQVFENYDVGSSTTSKPREIRQMPIVKDIEKEEEHYTSGKPRRIIIRARITHD